MENVKPDIKASLSIEMSVVCTMFFLAMTAVFTFFQLMIIESNVQSAITSAAKELAQYDYLYQLADKGKLESGKTEESGKTGMAGKNGLSIAYAKSRIYHYLPKNGVEKYLIKNGIFGISCSFSDFSQKGLIDIVVIYKVKGWIDFFGKIEIPVKQRARVHGWSGYEDIVQTEGEEEEIVYITVTGTVYHRSKECRHLKLSIHQVAYASLENRRNHGGGKYYPCEHCGKNISGGLVYITEEGDRYHSTLNCSGLKRGILSIPLSEAGDRRACSGCGT